MKENGMHIEMLGSDFLVHESVSIKEKSKDGLDQILERLGSYGVENGIMERNLSFRTFNMNDNDGMRFFLCEYNSGFLLMYRGDQKKDKLQNVENRINSLMPEYGREPSWNYLSNNIVGNVVICPLWKIDKRSVHFQSNAYSYVEEHKDYLMNLFADHC